MFSLFALDIFNNIIFDNFIQVRYLYFDKHICLVIIFEKYFYLFFIYKFISSIFDKKRFEVYIEIVFAILYAQVINK